MDDRSAGQQHDIVVIGASAGGVEALMRLCRDLPPDFPAAVLVVQHMASHAHSQLPFVLNRAGVLPARAAVDGEAPEPGRIYVAVPDHHLLLRPGRILLRRGPHENRTRPAANALFRSAAIAYGARVIGVVLTGLLDDGTEGLIAIKQAGGLSVVQHPDDAAWPSMPRNAIVHDHVDHAVPLAEMSQLLSRLVREPAGPSTPLPADVVAEDRIAGLEATPMSESTAVPGAPSSVSCPQCGGVLNQLADDGIPRFRCQVGHAFTGAGLSEAQGDELERALVVAIRTHRDRIELFRRMQASAASSGHSHAQERWQKAAVEAEQLARVLEQALCLLTVQADETD